MALRGCSYKNLFIDSRREMETSKIFPLTFWVVICSLLGSGSLGENIVDGIFGRFELLRLSDNRLGSISDLFERFIERECGHLLQTALCFGGYLQYFFACQEFGREINVIITAGAFR